ncbi:MAG TPA: hypothetical protein VNH18_00045 [Bryobacteraceae bacterium]|nr:hypothetical protein [Bryobacteraceae bacterium]
MIPTEERDQSLAAGLPTTRDGSVVTLPSGNPLDLAGASTVLRAVHTPVVLLAGAAKAGKTTLLASLYDAFQRGPFGGYLAAGSQTLVGFEERCFDARRSSRAVKPSTQRTKFQEGHLYYHLKLRPEDLGSQARHLFLLDMSGEWYERATDFTREANTLGAVFRRADHVVHLVNAARLASHKYRVHTQSNVSMLMRRLSQSGLLTSTMRIDVLLTKWDLILLAGGHQLAAETDELAQALFPAQYREKVKRLRITPVAARPDHRSSLEPEFGLKGLFRDWIEELPIKLQNLPAPSQLSDSQKPFDRFGVPVHGSR